MRERQTQRLIWGGEIIGDGGRCWFDTGNIGEGGQMNGGGVTQET